MSGVAAVAGTAVAGVAATPALTLMTGVAPMAAVARSVKIAGLAEAARDRVACIALVDWNPARPVFPTRIGRLLPFRRPVNNFGDLLAPEIVAAILAQRGIRPEDAVSPRRLLSVGSVIRLAGDGDVIWGTGVNGKSLDHPYGFRTLDVRAVRGPLTREFLLGRGQDVPEIYGDPGLLTGLLWPRETVQREEWAAPTLIVPNFNDWSSYRSEPNVLSPRTDLRTCIARIASAEFVIGSSLHAIVLAESFGIPARFIASAHEPAFKYEDYYLGSGRSGYHPGRSIAHAMGLGGEVPPVWSATPLLDAFPADLWRPTRPR